MWSLEEGGFNQANQIENPKAPDHLTVGMVTANTTYGPCDLLLFPSFAL